ncbi:MAG: GGDEF domain-containing protein, partial [Bacteroidota bacterium]
MNKNIWEIIKETDWSATSLGPREGWSHNLITTLNICLTSPAFMMVFWGSDHIVFRNNAGKHMLREKYDPTLGKPAKEVW